MGRTIGTFILIAIVATIIFSCGKADTTERSNNNSESKAFVPVDTQRYDFPQSNMGQIRNDAIMSFYNSTDFSDPVKAKEALIRRLNQHAFDAPPMDMACDIFLVTMDQRRQMVRRPKNIYSWLPAPVSTAMYQFIKYILHKMGAINPTPGLNDKSGMCSAVEDHTCERLYISPGKFKIAKKVACLCHSGAASGACAYDKTLVRSIAHFTMTAQQTVVAAIKDDVTAFIWFLNRGISKTIYNFDRKV